MKDEILFYNAIMKKGTLKGELNTCTKKIKYILRNLIYYKYSQEIIISSYNFLNTYFNKIFLSELYENGISKICEIEGKNTEKLSFYLKIYTDFEKEGEFNIICTNQEGEQLTKLTFAIKDNKIIIGGLQGMQRNKPSEEIKKITKSFYGIFPKRLVIEILYALFPNYSKVAVGNKGHVYLALRYKFKKSRKINADYDKFWKSLGSQKENDIFWSLPQKLARKNIEDIPSKKRSQYISKCKILDELDKRVKFFLSQKLSKF